MNDIDRLKEDKSQKKNYMSHGNNSFSADLIDTPIYNEAMMDSVLDGIVQNIYLEMDKQGITVRELAERSGVDYSHLSRMFSGKSHIGITTLLKLVSVLHVSPNDLFPYDANKRKTDGQRYDEITREMDVKSNDFLLGLIADIVREWRRVKSNIIETDVMK